METGKAPVSFLFCLLGATAAGARQGGARGAWNARNPEEGWRTMLSPKPRCSRLQECFLPRAARLSVLNREYTVCDGPPDERALLVRWAVRSTMADCLRLGVGPEALALFVGG